MLIQCTSTSLEWSWFNPAKRWCSLSLKPCSLSAEKVIYALFPLAKHPFVRALRTRDRIVRSGQHCIHGLLAMV